MQSSERSTRSSRKFVPEQMAPPVPEAQTDSGPFLCMECSETFDTRLELNSHCQSHVTKRQYTCAQCGQGFHHQVFLQMHERSHEGGAPARATRVISTRSSKMAAEAARPTYSKPQRLLNTIVEFKNEQNACQAFAPIECVTRRGHGASTSQKDGLETKNIFQLRISKYSDTTVHLMDSFGNSIEILADVFNTYTIGESEKSGVTTNDGETLSKASEEASPEDPMEEASVSEASPHVGEMGRPPSHEAVTDDARVCVPAPADTGHRGALEQEEPSSDTIQASNDLPSSSISPEKDELGKSDTPDLRDSSPEAPSGPDHMDSSPEEPAGPDHMDSSPEEPAGPDHMDSSPEEPAGPDHIDSSPEEPAGLDHMDSSPEYPSVPTPSQDLPEAFLEAAEPSSTPIDGTKSRHASITVLPADQILVEGPSALKDAACSIPGEINRIPEEAIADVEQNPDVASSKPASETVQAPPADLPPKKGDLPTQPATTFMSPLEGSFLGEENADLCNTMSSDVSLTNSQSMDTGVAKEPEATEVPRVAIEPGPTKEPEAQITEATSEERSKRIGADTVIPEKRDLRPVSGEEPPKEDIDVETDICMASPEAGESPEGEARSPERSLQVDNKEPEKHCSLLSAQDMLQDDDLVMDDKRDDDLFERDIFPLGAPMEVCVKGLTSMEPSIVCGGEAHGTKMVREKESDICLNGSDMTYISESEMIKLLEQDKDDLPDDEPISDVQKDLENIGTSQKESGQQNATDGVLQKQVDLPASTDQVNVNSEIRNLRDMSSYRAKETTPDSELPASFLTDVGLQLGEIDPQETSESMSAQDSMAFTETSSSSYLQLPSKANPELPQTEPGGDKPGTPEEDTGVFVTVEDKEGNNDTEANDNKVQQMDNLERPSLAGAGMESGPEKPQTSRADYKDPQIMNLPSSHEFADPKPLSNADLEMGNPPLDVLDYIPSIDDQKRSTSLETRDLQNEEMGDETNADPQKQTPDLPSDRSSTSKTLESKEKYLPENVDELPSAETDRGALNDQNMGKPSLDITKEVSEVKAVDGSPTKQLSDASSEGQPLFRDSVEDLDDSKLMENDHQGDEDNIDKPHKPTGVGGECLKCGRKIRRGRREMVRLPVCFKCRMAAKKKERLSRQESALGLDLPEPVLSRKAQSLSEEFSDSAIKQDNLDDSVTSLDPLVSDNNKEDLGKKMYECPKCDKAFKIPALLAGHMKCHTLPQCLTCGCSMPLKYKNKRTPKRCQKCLLQLKQKTRAGGEGSGDEGSGASDDEDVDIDVEEVSDEESHVADVTAKSKLKNTIPATRGHTARDDVSGLSGSPDKSLSDKETDGEDPEFESYDELDVSDLADGEKPRLCPQCGKAFRCNRSLNLHLISHSVTQCESCGSRLPKRRRFGRWSKRCRACRLQVKGQLLSDGVEEIDLSGDAVLKQKNLASLRLKAKKTKMVKTTKLQSMIKKKKELKWTNMLLAVKGLMDKSRKKKESALLAADPAKKDGESSKGEAASADDAKSDPHDADAQKDASSDLPSPTNKATSRTPKQGRKCLYKEKNIIKVEENEVLPLISPSAASISTAFIKQEEMWQCLECTQNWPNCEALVNHQHSHTSEQSFTCTQCPQVFSTEQYLNIHIHAHDEVRPFRCPECDKTFTKRNHLGVHLRVHSGLRPFVCPDCPCRFRQKVTLIAHRYTHRNYQLLFAKPFQCSVCSKSFKQKERLVVHERLHTGECPFSCKDCDKVFPSKARLYVHRKMHKMAEDSSSADQDLSVSEGKQFKCPDCGKICSTKASFVLHRKVHRLSSITVQSIKREQNEELHPFSCKECDKVFSSKATLSMHLKNHSAHKATAKPETSPDHKQCFPCKKCGKVCATKASLVLHRKVHKSPGDPKLVIKVESDAPSYICKFCNKVCSTKASLVLHCKVHKTDSEAPSFKCKDCDTVCYSKSSFVLHRKVHKTPMATGSEAPSFKCKDCDTVCHTKSSFVLHRKMHKTPVTPDTETPSFKCKDCDTVCHTKSSFVLHRKMHKTPVTPDTETPSFKCKDCDTVCHTKYSFVLHRKVHKTPVTPDTETPSFKCKDCDTVCHTKSSFVLHRKVHKTPVTTDTETPSFKCKDCDTVCHTKSSFVLHTKVHRPSSSTPQSPKTDAKSYSCKHCEMVCSTKASFVLHSKVHKSLSISEPNLKSDAESQLYNCKHCDMVCPTKASFVLHNKTHRLSTDGEQSPQTSEEPHSYTCKHCNMVCSTKASFVLHSKIHRSLAGEQNPKTAEESFSCKECDTVCSTKASLALHSKEHKSGQNEDNLHTCKDCNKVCSTKASLILHRRVHKPSAEPKGESPFQCKDCGKIFSSKGRLSAHSKRHEDSPSPDQDSDNVSGAEKPKKATIEKPYSCTICGLGFTNFKVFVRHKAVHGERSVTPCIHCGKRFLYMKSLFNHMKICRRNEKKLLKKAAAKRKVPKDAEGEIPQKKRKTDEKPKALTAAQKLKNKNLTVKTKKAGISKEKGKAKGPAEPKTKEKRAKADADAASEVEGKKATTEKQEKPSEQAAKEPTPKKTLAKKVKKEPAKDKAQKVGGAGPKKWRMLAASTVKKKNLQAILIGGKKKYILKKKVQLKTKSGAKVAKD